MTAEESTPTPAFFVALVGSAANTEQIEKFLEEFRAPPEAAIIIILQHREALEQEGFVRAAQAANRRFALIEHGMPVEVAGLYLSSANEIVTVESGRFDVRAAAEQPGHRGTVDSFLISLAQQEEVHAVAVVFQLTGGDGTLGVTAIKEAGGLAVVEQDEKAKAGDLSRTNSPAALADFILPAEDLAKKLGQYLREMVSERSAPQRDAKENEKALHTIATILQAKTSHDFDRYKRGTFLRRVHRRMKVVQAAFFDEYIEILRSNPDEVLLLFNDLLIGVTHFFRDAREFDLLEREVIPKLFGGKDRDDQVRVWVIGCSTGEEAYSLAILLREYMAGLDVPPQVQIFASDLDGRALAAARAGRYTDRIVQEMSAARLSRWFVKEGNTYCVVKELREMCIFSQHSVIKDAPFSRLDLISCRNLLIYLEADLQSRVIPLFHFALRPGGYLFLGNSENVSRQAGLFEPVENRSRIFKRLDQATRTLPEFPFSAISRRILDAAPSTRRNTVPPPALVGKVERVLERHAPSYVITDEAYNVLHFSGRTGRYLEPAGGAATLNLISLVHPDIRNDLKSALSRASAENATVQMRSVHIASLGEQRKFDIFIEPVVGPSERSFVVLFKEAATFAADEDAVSDDAEDERVRRLQAELQQANERLQSAVEELETTNEELKSSNEEYQSLNEELQSANEELETSKEELQSVNEELTTVNGELGHRVQELGRTNSDLKNLLESTRIATIFLTGKILLQAPPGSAGPMLAQPIW